MLYEVQVRTPPGRRERKAFVQVYVVAAMNEVAAEALVRDEHVVNSKDVTVTVAALPSPVYQARGFLA